MVFGSTAPFNRLCWLTRNAHQVHLPADEISAADVATVALAGPPSAFQRAFAAADIAARHALRLFGPLVGQLFERAAHIVLRLPAYGERAENDAERELERKKREKEKERK